MAIPSPSFILTQPFGSLIAASGAFPDSDIQRSPYQEVIAKSAVIVAPGSGGVMPRAGQGISISAVTRGWSAPK